MLARSAPKATMAGQRSANRLRLGVPATLTLTHETVSCMLDDISAIGARLRIAKPVAKGAVARIDFHELHIFASVVWCRNGECGLRFETPLPPEDMQGMLWITQNKAKYQRLCQEVQARDWSD